MRRRLFALTVCILLMGCIGTIECLAAVIPPEIEPQYDLTLSTRAGLTISDSGVASCSGTIRANATTSQVNITLRLYKKSGSSWLIIKTWTKTDQPFKGSISETYNVGAGTYKVIASGKVTAADGQTEYVSVSTGEKVYK